MPRPFTSVPMTYVHDGRDFLGELDTLLPEVTAAAPDIYHINPMNVPFPNTSGPAFPVEGIPDYIEPPELVQKRLERARRVAETFHEAGVKWVLPYICNQTLVGHPDTRTGIWMFYDRWDDYTEFGIGPRPDADPIDWMAREPDGELHFNYEMRHVAFTQTDQFRYAPCVNNPYYREYQRVVVEGIAKAGYDGVFVDNNNLNCYCEWCQKAFKNRMLIQYESEQLKDLFGWESPDEITLGIEGNRFQWLKGDPVFREFLAATQSSEELIRWFGTDDLDAVKLADAGNGWLWGRANEYRSWVYAKYSPRKREEVWGSPVLDGWGIRTRQDRLLWAETMRFWAESNSEDHRLVKTWGSDILGRDFKVVPNWGNMQQYEDIMFRQEIGHDVKRWLPYMDCNFWEDDGDPGRVAPGVYLDFILEYRFSFAHGMKSATMAALPQDEPTCELAHAEAAATGNSAFIQRMPEFPELRNRYMDLFRSYPEWFEGHRSAAEVALVFSAENLMLGNEEHIHQVYRWNHYFADQQVPIDFLIEEHLWDISVLQQYRLIIAPALQYLSDEQCQALTAFVQRGGTLVTTGDTATHDMATRSRDDGPLADLLARTAQNGSISVVDDMGRFIHAPGIGNLIPTGTITREDAYEIAQSNFRLVERKISRHQIIAAGDYAVKIERFHEPGRMQEVVDDWHRLQVCDPYEACGLRVFPYVDLSDVSGTGDPTGFLTVHLVNYNVDLTKPAGTRRQEPLEDVDVHLHIPHGWRVDGAEWLEPGTEPVAIETESCCCRTKVHVQKINTYGIIRLTLRGQDIS